MKNSVFLLSIVLLMVGCKLQGFEDPDCPAGPQLWYQDLDHDGYTNPTGTLEACDDPDGANAQWVAHKSSESDCDDGDSEVHPDASESLLAGDGCSDGKDNDCDGLADDRQAACMNPVVLSDLRVTSVTINGFTVLVDVLYDQNGDAVLTLYYCNTTDNPTCDPQGAGSSQQSMVGGSGHFSASISSLSPPDDPGDSFVLLVVAEDADGVLGFPATGQVQLLHAFMIYRSVATDPSALASGGGVHELAVTEGLAHFTSPIPDNVGVGDVIQYDGTDLDSEEDDGLFIVSGRLSDSEYILKTVAGLDPSQEPRTTHWSIYRAYVSLLDAESFTESWALHPDLRDFDLPGGGVMDLVADNKIWNIACYGGNGADVGSIHIQDWETSADNYLRIYSPTLPSEVGRSQRHQGRWNSSAYYKEE